MSTNKKPVFKTDVIKHSAAIQISNEVSLLQRKVWNILLAYAFDNLMVNEEHFIELKDLYSLLEYNSNDINYIKELLKNLVSINVEWNLFGKDGKQQWGVVSLLSEVVISDGILTYSFASGLRKKLYNPSMYAKLSLSLQNKFTSKYSLCLYEIFIDYFDIKRDFGETPWIGIEEFRKLLGLKDNEYKRYTDLNHYIIKKSINEINLLTDLDINLPFTKKNKRTVCELKFIIRKKDNKQILPLIDILPNLKKNPLLNILVTEFGIENKKAVKLANDYEENHILEKIKYVRSLKYKKTNVAGLLIRAITENWTVKKIEDNTEIIKVKSNTEIKEEIIKIVSDIRKKKTQNKFNNLSESEQEILRNEFKNNILSGKYNQFIINNFSQKGFDGVGIKIQFNHFLVDKLLGPVEVDIEEYMNNINFQEKDEING
jgi:hypothetical protein